MKSRIRFIHKFKPAAHKIWLHLLAGMVWLGVGLMLTSFSSRWLKPVARSSMFLLIFCGLALAILIYHFGFSRIARKNISRISAFAKERVCLFAFQEWKSYPLVGFMVSLGIYLRTYSSIPKPILGVLYLGIGGGLFFASLHYFVHAISMVKVQPHNLQK